MPFFFYSFVITNMPLDSFFVLAFPFGFLCAPCVCTMYVFMKVSNIRKKKNNGWSANDEVICRNVCGIYDLMYESGTLMCASHRKTDEMKWGKWISVKTTQKHKHTRTHSHSLISIYGIHTKSSFVLNGSIERLVLRESHMYKRLLYWNWTKRRFVDDVCVRIWKREWMTLVREHVGWAVPYVNSGVSRTYSWASE